MTNKMIKQPLTITETIFQFIKKSIINGEFKPNQRLHEKEIAELFNVSTTPTREAFQRLSAEKYLILNARKEVIVAGLSPEGIKELYEVIRVLDVFSTKKALEIITDKDISELKKMTDRLSELNSWPPLRKEMQRKWKKSSVLTGEKIITVERNVSL
jgi:DNA-binding GntR family transcriptional regulator